MLNFTQHFQIYSMCQRSRGTITGPDSHHRKALVSNAKTSFVKEKESNCNRKPLKTLQTDNYKQIFLH